MIYKNETMQRAMSLARHAYAGRINRRGKLLYLQAFNDVMPGISEEEAAVFLLRKAISETGLSLEQLRAAQIDESIIDALITDHTTTIGQSIYA